MAFAGVVHTPGAAAEAQPQKRGRAIPYLLLAPGMLWLAVFFVLPIALLFTTSLMVPVPGGEIGEYAPAARFANYVDAVTTYWPQFLRSFGYGLLATVLALAIGYPLAYAIAVRARHRKLLQQMLLVMVIAPFFVSFILRTLAWRQILADESVVVTVLKAIQILPDGARLTATPVAVIAGLTYNFLPFMTLPIYASLERLDLRLIEAGQDLYASAVSTFRRVTLPLSMPGVVAGTLLTFIPATGDYVNAALLGTSRTAMIGNVIDSRFFRVVDYPTAAALSFLLMGAIVVLVAAYVRRAGTEDLV
ncbi:MAG TPA: ABC transporter permease [Actinomycetales bacterium]|jgi:spermidine/putrescine transport system permease protein|nr:ABC transporter permease [Actinomycetales bacterium]